MIQCLLPSLSRGGFFCLYAALFWGAGLPATEPGVDAVIAAHIEDPEARTAILRRLSDDGITWIRERSSWPNTANDNRATWSEAREAGLRVLAFSRQVNGQLTERPAGRNRLGQDLLEVYQKASLLASSHHGTVDAWELLNEPEFLFVADNPDSAAAFQKALYLGLKAGDPETPVLRPAIGGSPGGYWEVALRNGLWDYGDAGNVHFYGWPETLDEILEDHRLQDARAFAQGWTRVNPVPLWITEINNYRGRLGVSHEHAERVWAEQSDALTRMWEIAVGQNVAVFMPFVLRWKKRPELSLFDQELRALPPWESYRRAFHNEPATKNKEPATKNGLIPDVHGPPSPIVLQWVPDESTGTPNKFSGAYRFLRRAGVPAADRPVGQVEEVSPPATAFLPMRGELRIYNFSDQPVSGRLSWSVGGGVRVQVDPELSRSSNHSIDSTITVGDLRPFSRLSLPVTFHAPDAEEARWFRGTFSAEFLKVQPDSVSSTGEAVSGGPRSLLYFRVEPTPDWDLFETLPLVIETESLSPVRALDPGTVQTPRDWLEQTDGSHPRWIEEREDPGLISWESVAEQGKQAAATNESPATAIGKGDRRLRLAPVPVTASGALDLHHRDYPFGYEWTSQLGVWSGINGLQLREVSSQKGAYQVLKVTVDPLEHEKKHPRAVVRLPFNDADSAGDGLPGNAVIALRASREFTDAPFNIGVFLVDRWGQAWRVDEQIHWSALGPDGRPHLQSRDKFLPLTDFVHAYFSNRVPGARLQPQDIVEIQLAFPRRPYPEPITVAIGVLVPK